MHTRTHTYTYVNVSVSNVYHKKQAIKIELHIFPETFREYTYSLISHIHCNIYNKLNLYAMCCVTYPQPQRPATIASCENHCADMNFFKTHIKAI